LIANQVLDLTLVAGIKINRRLLLPDVLGFLSWAATARSPQGSFTHTARPGSGVPQRRPRPARRNECACECSHRWFLQCARGCFFWLSCWSPFCT